MSKEHSSKRRKTGRMYEVMKKMRLQSHEFGEFCDCARLKCTQVINEAQRQHILDHINSLATHNEQNSYLTSLITLNQIQQRRSRKDEEEAKLHDASYCYSVTIKQEYGNYKEVQVCANFFRAVHGITPGKLQYLQTALKTTGVAPKDKRGGKNYKQLKPEIVELVRGHIASFQARQSHYSIKDNRDKVYLPEDLNIKKMHRLFQELNPGMTLSYQTYREIFRRDFNISFGYPRSDTCSQCDELAGKVKAAANDDTKLKALQLEKELHLRRANTFYVRKRKARLRAGNEKNFEAIAMDYQKNISLPNITTNDVYYKRQLSMFSFNIHVLSNADSYFYTYPEYMAKKGSDEVSSFLFHFIMNYLPAEVEHLHIFCDGAGGQNKNYTVIRFIHYVVSVVKRLKSIRITYPVRGHSYLECDKNMGLVNTKKRMELPADWEENLLTSRIKPAPFVVISVDQSYVKKWTEFLAGRFVKKCPFPMQKMKEVEAFDVHPRVICHRDTYNGTMLQSPIQNKRKIKPQKIKPGEFELPSQSYLDLIPISLEKYEDIKILSKFCESEENKKFFQNIPHRNEKKK